MRSGPLKVFGNRFTLMNYTFFIYIFTACWAKLLGFSCWALMIEISQKGGKWKPIWCDCDCIMGAACLFILMLALFKIFTHLIVYCLFTLNVIKWNWSMKHPPVDFYINAKYPKYGYLLFLILDKMPKMKLNGFM